MHFFRPPPKRQSQMEPGTANNGSAFNQQMPSDLRRSSLAPKGSGAWCTVAHGFRQPARAGSRVDRSGDLGSGLYELQCRVARTEPSAGAASSRRQAVVPDDCRQVAGASGTDGTHLYPASTRARLAAPTRLSSVGDLQVGSTGLVLPASHNMRSQEGGLVAPAARTPPPLMTQTYWAPDVVLAM
jgi:hypothetical protein